MVKISICIRARVKKSGIWYPEWTGKEHWKKRFRKDEVLLESWADWVQIFPGCSGEEFRIVRVKDSVTKIGDGAPESEYICLAGVDGFVIEKL